VARIIDKNTVQKIIYVNKDKILVNIHISPKRRRTVNLKVVSKREINIIAPKHMNIDNVVQFLEKNKRWVKNNIKRFREPLNRIDVNDRNSRSTILFMGRFYPLIVDGTPGLQFDGAAFHTNQESSSKLREMVKTWYKTIATEIIPNKVRDTSLKHKLHARRVRIGRAKTALGTCSGKNELTFSWRLIMCPEFVIDYVVVHELAHTKHHNHSKWFWALVKKMMPGYQIAEAWIKKHIPEIHEI